MVRQKESSDLTYKLIAAFIVLLIPTIGVFLALYAVLFGEFAETAYWFGILLIMFSPIGVAANIMLYKGRL